MEKLGRLMMQCFIGLLPWSVLIAVVGTLKLDFSLFRYWKELFLCIFLSLFFIDIFRKRIAPAYDKIDIFIVLFGLSLIIVSFFNGVSMLGYAYGLRYDLEFLVAFILLRRLFPLYGLRVQDFCRVFLVSGGAMILVAILIRYVFGEEVLTVFGFDPQVSQFSGGSGWPPKIYYLVQGEDAIRFQGLLEGPNQMAYFLLIYLGVIWFYLGNKKSLKFIFGFSTLVCLYLLFITYSRSAILGAFTAGILVIIIGFLRGKIQSKISFKKIFSITAVLLLSGAFFMSDIQTVFVKKGSTNAHLERMMIGMERFLAAPYGIGLGEAGPASRGVHDINNDKKYYTDIAGVNDLVQKFAARNNSFYLMSEYFYIPESWYLQQLIQGGIVGFLLFISLMGMFFQRLSKSLPLLWLFSAVLIMNIFLHAFESMHASLLLFSLLAAYCPVLTDLGKK